MIRSPRYAATRCTSASVTGGAKGRSCETTGAKRSDPRTSLLALLGPSSVPACVCLLAGAAGGSEREALVAIYQRRYTQPTSHPAGQSGLARQPCQYQHAVNCTRCRPAHHVDGVAPQRPPHIENMRVQAVIAGDHRVEAVGDPATKAPMRGCCWLPALCSPAKATTMRYRAGRPRCLAGAGREERHVHDCTKAQAYTRLRAGLSAAGSHPTEAASDPSVRTYQTLPPVSLFAVAPGAHNVVVPRLQDGAPRWRTGQRHVHTRPVCR